MTETGTRRLTGVLLLLTPVIFNGLFTLLAVTFEYPDVLRQPADSVLRSFDAGGPGLVVLWYGFAMTAVLFVPLAVLLGGVLSQGGVATPLMGLATAFGVIAGVVQFLGLIRWPILVPYLAETYLDPDSGEATREAVAVVFAAFNQYAGVAVGEHLGYLFTGLWTVLVALSMRRSPLFGRLGRLLALFGVAAAGGVLAGTLEIAGLAWAADVVVVGYVLWSVWLAATGILLLRRASAPVAGTL